MMLLPIGEGRAEEDKIVLLGGIFSIFYIYTTIFFFNLIIFISHSCQAVTERLEEVYLWWALA